MEDFSGMEASRKKEFREEANIFKYYKSLSKIKMESCIVDLAIMLCWSHSVCFRPSSACFTPRSLTSMNDINELYAFYLLFELDQ